MVEKQNAGDDRSSRRDATLTADGDSSAKRATESVQTAPIAPAPIGGSRQDVARDHQRRMAEVYELRDRELESTHRQVSKS